jgi:hypothetical protein
MFACGLVTVGYETFRILISDRDSVFWFYWVIVGIGAQWVVATALAAAVSVAVHRRSLTAWVAVVLSTGEFAFLVSLFLSNRLSYI